MKRVLLAGLLCGCGGQNDLHTGVLWDGTVVDKAPYPLQEVEDEKKFFEREWRKWFGNKDIEKNKGLNLAFFEVEKPYLGETKSYTYSAKGINMGYDLQESSYEFAMLRTKVTTWHEYIHIILWDSFQFIAADGTPAILGTGDRNHRKEPGPWKQKHNDFLIHLVNKWWDGEWGLVYDEETGKSNLYRRRK